MLKTEMENEKELVDILSQIPIFNGLDDKALGKIVPHLESATYSSDTVIIEEGTSGDSMYIIKKGTVSVTKAEKNNNVVNLGNLYAGSYFGELSLIDNLPRSANVKSIEETEIFKLNKKNFDSLLSTDEKIANLFYKNCINETFSRFRNIISNFTFSQHILREKSAILTELNRDLSSAKKIQNYFINAYTVDSEDIFTGNVKHSYIYKPCLAIGGDFFNIVRNSNGSVSMIIADFEGHGISAALGTGVLKSAYSIILEKMGEKPVELLEFLNNHFYTVIKDLYATCYYSVIHPESNKITIAKAGHHHPLFWRKRFNDFIDINCGGIGLGIVPDGKFQQVEFDIEPGDKILFYTDGIIEQESGSGEMYSKNRLKFIFNELIANDEPDILDKLIKDLEFFSGSNSFSDDVTLLLFEF